MTALITAKLARSTSSIRTTSTRGTARPRPSCSRATGIARGAATPPSSARASTSCRCCPSMRTSPLPAPPASSARPTQRSSRAAAAPAAAPQAPSAPQRQPMRLCPAMLATSARRGRACHFPAPPDRTRTPPTSPHRKSARCATRATPAPRAAWPRRRARQAATLPASATLAASCAPRATTRASPPPPTASAALPAGFALRVRRASWTRSARRARTPG